jgi:hypothetical protein
MTLTEVMKKAGVPDPFPARSLTYDEYCALMKIACPHGPDEPCTCEGCGACPGGKYGCTCDIDWDLMQDIRDMWY